MENFEWISPTQFVFGRKAEEQVGPWAKEHGYKSIMLVYGQGHVVKSGLLDRVKKSLDDAGVAWCELGGVRPNPEVTTAREGVRLAKEHAVDLMVPVGGGSTIDCAKAIAIGATSEADVWEFYKRPNPQPVVDALPKAVVLTIPAAGSEASNSSVLSNEEIDAKSGCNGDFNRPVVAFMNPELTFSLPPYQTAAGITDMCAHIFERYFSATGDTPVSDNIAVGLLRAIRVSAYRIQRNPSDYDARAEIMWAGTLAHNGLTARGREEDWVSHGMEHELSASKTEVTHGAGLAVIFPAWMRHVYKQNPQRFVNLGVEWFGLVPTGDVDADALNTIDRIQEFFVSIGMPRYMDDFGFVKADVEEMLPRLKVNRGGSWPIGNFASLDEQDCREIYLSAFKPEE